MKNLIAFVTFLNVVIFADCRQMYLSFNSVEGAEVAFEMEEFLYGEDNCCDEYPISFCEEGTIYYEKEDYADLSDPENWDIISDNVALLRGDNQMLYNPIIENSQEFGSPQGTLWRGGPTYSNNVIGGITPYGNAGVLNIIYVARFLPVNMNGTQMEVNLVSNYDGPLNYTVGLYQIENRNDNVYLVQTAGSQMMTSFGNHPGLLPQATWSSNVEQGRNGQK